MTGLWVRPDTDQLRSTVSADMGVSERCRLTWSPSPQHTARRTGRLSQPRQHPRRSGPTLRACAVPTPSCRPYAPVCGLRPRDRGGDDSPRPGAAAEAGAASATPVCPSPYGRAAAVMTDAPPTTAAPRHLAFATTASPRYRARRLQHKPANANLVGSMITPPTTHRARGAGRNCCGEPGRRLDTLSDRWGDHTPAPTACLDRPGSRTAPTPSRSPASTWPRRPPGSWSNG